MKYNFYKKIIAYAFYSILSVGLIFSLSKTYVKADNNSIEAVKMLNLVNDVGRTNERSFVTRAEFAKMIISFTKNDKITKKISKKQLFKDVKKKYNYTPYVNLASLKGFMRGFSNSKFYPKKHLTMNVAIYSCLKMLGYSDTELSSPDNGGIMQKFNSLGLNNDINKNLNEKLNKKDCIRLFANMLNVSKKDGTIYGKSLGYTFNADGTIDVHSIIKNGTKMMIAKSNGIADLFITPKKIIKNDKLSKASEIEKYDLLYYNKSNRVLYAYSTVIYGQLNDVQPSITSPKNVIIAGKNYELSDPIEVDSGIFSSITSFRSIFSKNKIEKGSFVVAVRDLNGKIVAIYNQAMLKDKIIGYVLKNENKKIGDGYGGFAIKNVMTIVTTQNNEIEVPLENMTVGYGHIVSVIYDVNGNPVVSLKDSEGGRLKDKEDLIKSDANILEVADQNHEAIMPSMLKNIDLKNAEALYIGYDKEGKINDLILKDTTGEAYKYGLITENNGDSIGYLLAEKKSFSGYSGYLLDLSKPAGAFSFKDGELTSIKTLNEVNISNISGNIANTANGDYMIADNVPIYYFVGGKWKYDNNLSDMKNLRGHSIKGCYLENTNIIRVIIIEK